MLLILKPFLNVRNETVHDKSNYKKYYFCTMNNTIQYFSFKQSSTINPDWLGINQSKSRAPLFCNLQNLCHPTPLTGKSK